MNPADAGSSDPDREDDSFGQERDRCCDSCESDTSSATPSPSDGETVRYSVPEMDCPSCAGKVEKSVASLDGVDSIDPQPTTGTLTVGYDPERTTPDAIRERVEKAGYPVEDGTAARLTLDVPDMDCASCAGKVENALADLGVPAFDTRPTTGRVVVTDAGPLSTAEITRSIENAGYEVVGTSDDGGDARAEQVSVWRSARAIKTWISGAFVLLGLLFEFVLAGPSVALGEFTLTLADGLFLLAVAAGGQAIVRNGYYSLVNRNLDIDLLMSIAIVGAILASFVFDRGLYMEAATLAFLFSVAELLERYSMDRARHSMRELMDLSPDEATVKRDGGEVTVPVEEVAVGDIVVVKPGEKIPMDGEIVAGESAVDQSPITGESVPVDKTAGDEVYAGTINEGGYLELQVTSAAGDDTLSRVIELVEDAQANRTEREQFVERFAGYYTPIVVTFAVLTAAVPPLLFDASAATWFVYGLTLIVLSCPCAFVISTPVTVVSGITSAAKNGVLIKGGTHLEAMGAVDVVAFDKTGTLTRGELAVTDVIPLNGNTEDDVLRCARGLERRSEHPIGEAIVAQAAEADVAEREIADFEAITGKGVRADLDGTRHYAGKPGLFEELGFDLSHVHATTDGGQVTRTSRDLCERNDCLDLLEEAVPELQSEGKTVVLVGTEDELEGVIAVADEIRPEARETIERLHDLGVSRVAMLTGDNERTARAIAEELGVDEFHAELLPDEKVELIERLAAEGGVPDSESGARRAKSGGVAMVGDGINDAPALATATVGIAMGAAGTDTALETADVALMADDLSKLPYLYELSHRANGVIRQNVWSSLAAKAALALAVPFGLVPIWLAVLAGDAGMTLGVTGNAMRLSRITPGETDESAAA